MHTHMQLTPAHCGMQHDMGRLILGCMGVAWVRFVQRNTACGDCDRPAASLKAIAKRIPAINIGFSYTINIRHLSAWD